MEKVLVTGGAGYVGSHACKALAAAGYLPVTFDNLSHGHRWAVRWGPLEVGDLADRARLDLVLEAHRPIAALHFAAFAYVGESVEDPIRYYQNNVAATVNLIAALRDHGIGMVVFSSTCATYGVPRRIPLSEDHPQNPINPYGSAKLMVERILLDCEAAYGLRAVALRYFNAAGADPDGEIGEAHDPETHLIPLALDAVLGRRDALSIFGEDYDTPDGTCVRDYIHVTDLADAHVRALAYLRAGHPGSAFNLGNGSGYSVRQVVDTVRQVTGLEVPVVSRPRRLGDPPILVADSQQAREVLGWQPQRPALATQIADAWRWHRSFVGGGQTEVKP